jgi:integral membrane protein (TIGR00529 family)
VAVIGLILAMGMIIFLIRKGVSLGLVMFIGVLIIGLFSPITLSEAGHIFWRTITDKTTVELLLIIFFISILGELLHQTGGLEQMVKNLNNFFTDPRLLLIFLPALIGSLPIAGGAVFSAPMVESTGKVLKMESWRMAVVNIFYRHLFYLLFPLYSGLILAIELSGYSFAFFARFNAGVVLSTFLFSFCYIFREKKMSIKRDLGANSWLKVKALLKSLAPLLIILITAFLLGTPLPLAMFFGTVAAFLNYLPRGKWQEEIMRRTRLIFPGIRWSMLLAIAGIMVFKNFVLASRAVFFLAERFIALGVPLLALAVVLPLLTGLVTGNPAAALGISLPIIMPMSSVSKGPEIYAGLVYIVSLVGYILSPAHLCLALTVEHFKADYSKVFKELCLLMFFMLLSAFLTALVWYYFVHW